MDSVSPLLPIRREDRGRAPIIIPPKIEKFPAPPGDRYFFLPFGNSVSTFDEFFAYFELDSREIKIKIKIRRFCNCKMEFSRWWKIYMCYEFQQKGCEKISSGREMRVRRRNNPRRKRGAKATSFINHSNQLTTACKNRWVNFFQVFPYGRVTRGTKWRHWGRARKDSQRVPSERVNQTRERTRARNIVGWLLMKL